MPRNSDCVYCSESFKSCVTTLLATLLMLFFVPPTAAARAFVRVNQMGYEVGASGRAYLMSSGSEKGASFSVLDASGTTIFSAPVDNLLGSWGAFTVYGLDFRIAIAGAYSIEVNGPFPATSTNFRIDLARKLYSPGVANALNFYQNERDGANFIPTPLRTAPGHLNDQNGEVFESPQFDSDDLILGGLQGAGVAIDASGGWWDAGDYLKFVQTHSYTVALMLIGVRDFPKQMGAGAGSSNFTSEALFGLNWLQKMWNDDSETLYYQVGIGTDFKNEPNILSDHDLWRLPQVDDTIGGNDPTLRYVRNRPVFVAGPAGSKISPNLAGRLAADFAECSQVFRDIQPHLANKCLVSAEHIFDLADVSPSGDLLTTAPFDFYGETEWRDDMELGATELYFALADADGLLPSGILHSDPMFYLRAAGHWAHAYIIGPNDAADTLNLYDVSGLAHFELFRAIANAGHPGQLEASQADLLHDLRKQLDNAVAQSGSDPFGFGFPWNVYDTATHGAGLSIMASEYSFLTESEAFGSYSRRWAGNILGANAWGSSFIVGDGQTFPNCMQHQVANIIGSLNGEPPILSGALVEGPNSFAATGFLDGMRKCPPAGGNVFAKFNADGAVYKDNEQSFSTVEPAIDLTASSFLMFAWRMAGSPTVLIPNRDASPAADQRSILQRNSLWPPRRDPGRHHARPGNPVGSAPN
jgi:endoglucanase